MIWDPTLYYEPDLTLLYNAFGSLLKSGLWVKLAVCVGKPWVKLKHCEAETVYQNTVVVSANRFSFYTTVVKRELF